MRKSIPKSYEYIEKLSPGETAKMAEARKNSENLGLAAISISSVEAQIIKFHLSCIMAKKVVEIGTLTGLSALHLLEVLPEDGCLFTLEKSVEHVEFAKKVLKDDLQKKRCRILVGDARETLNEISNEGPFDAVFIDGNKAAYLDYYVWAVKNVRVQGLIFCDNVFLAGAVWGQTTTQNFNPKQIEAVQKMNQIGFSDDRLQSMIIPTEEGLLISRKIRN